ncbi:hypothetical protein Bhyg_11849 [Pseudolycoriella hygida]|uniref:Uncharacterized protein n=1 Tax=Pseudolycoriella hygida TaxID=35572 RepID=A0A9Q0MXY1_9DIPT|nr:hypothetical protein Bhyg_11849 [Pseudolycoriella hygida]
MAISVHDEPVWNLERRESSGCLFWSRQSSKVKFLCDVTVLEYIQHPDEHNHDFSKEDKSSMVDKIENFMVVFGTCIAAIAITTFIPWLLFGGS